MKVILLAIFVGICPSIHAQQPVLERMLIAEFPASSTRDGRWIFNPKFADIRHLNYPLVVAAAPQYSFYSVTLVNYLGYHVTGGSCLIAYDSMRSKMLMVEPIWYGEFSNRFLKKFFHRRFSSLDSVVSFLGQLNDMMAEGTSFRFIPTSVSADSVAFDLISPKFEGTGIQDSSAVAKACQNGVVWRKVVYSIKDLSITQFTCINPSMVGDIDVIR